jgi:hypothetical protein
VTRARRVFIVVGIVVCLAGCRVDTHVDVALRADGSGLLRTTVKVDAEGVLAMGGPDKLASESPIDDLKAAGWKISAWSKESNDSETLTLTHAFANQSELTERILDLVGPNGVMQNPILKQDRGWFSSHSAFTMVVDLRSPSLGIVNDKTLAARLRAAGVDPAVLQAQIAVQLKTALHVLVTVHLPGGKTRAYVVAPGKLQTVRLADGGTDWDHVVKFGIGFALAFLAGLFFLAAGVGMRRNRRREVQRVTRDPKPERAPSM